MQLKQEVMFKGPITLGRYVAVIAYSLSYFTKISLDEDGKLWFIIAYRDWHHSLCSSGIRKSQPKTRAPYSRITFGFGNECQIGKLNFV